MHLLSTIVDVHWGIFTKPGKKARFAGAAGGRYVLLVLLLLLVVVLLLLSLSILTPRDTDMLTTNSLAAALQTRPGQQAGAGGYGGGGGGGGDGTTPASRAALLSAVKWIADPVLQGNQVTGQGSGISSNGNGNGTNVNDGNNKTANTPRMVKLALALLVRLNKQRKVFALPSVASSALCSELMSSVLSLLVGKGYNLLVDELCEILFAVVTASEQGLALFVRQSAPIVSTAHSGGAGDGAVQVFRGLGQTTDLQTFKKMLGAFVEAVNFAAARSR